VFPGDALTARAEVTAVDGGVVSFKVSTTNQNGDEVFTGTATARTD